jgi:hypothetical protein
MDRMAHDATLWHGGAMAGAMHQWPTRKPQKRVSGLRMADLGWRVGLRTQENRQFSYFPLNSGTR